LLILVGVAISHDRVAISHDQKSLVGCELAMSVAERVRQVVQAKLGLI